MITRICHEWTSVEHADTYEKFIVRKILPAIAAMHVKGLRRIELLRRLSESGKVEFMTIMWFDSWRAVKKFADEGHIYAYLPGIAKKVVVLSDKYYEVRRHLDYCVQEHNSG